MRFARLPAALSATLFISALAACGGGGGGTINPPAPAPSTSSNPNGPAPLTPTPTVKPTATSSPGNTPPPVSTPPPTATPTPVTTTVPNSKTTVDAGNGAINGADDMIQSSAPNTHGNKGEGDLMPGDAGATAQGGGQGADIDNIPCATSMPGSYHVHAFLGLYVNGQEIAIPDGVGMVNPYGESTYNNIANQELYANCFYYTHTHDATGMIHLEAPSPACGIASNYKTPCNMSEFTLGNFFDVWGISQSPLNFGPFNGPVTVYTSQLNTSLQCTKSPCYTPSNSYRLYTGDPAQIALYSHTVVWILVGSGNKTGPSLPNVQWWANP